MKTDTAPNPYLRTKVLTASPTELRLMLLDGALRFAKQARRALQQQPRPDLDASYEAICRAEKVVLELSSAMRPDQAPELCEKLAGLYNYIYRRLVDANMTREVAPLDEAINLLTYERETWVLAMSKLAEERAAA